MPHKTLLSLFCVALMAATTLAPAIDAQQDGQRSEDGQRRGDRGRGGRGGPGGGTFGFGRGGGASNPLSLLRIDEVRRELKVTEDQQELVDILSDELREGRPDFPENFRDLPREEQQAYFAKLQKAGEEQAAQAKETLKTILEEIQYKRLQEITIQTQGVDALLDSDVAAAIKLSDEQQAQLKQTQEAIEAERDAEREAARQERSGDGADRGNFDFQAMRERFEQARKEREDRFLAVLNDDQKQAFEALKGEKFDMPEPRFGGRGGRGPGGEGRRGRTGDGDSDRPQRPE